MAEDTSPASGSGSESSRASGSTESSGAALEAPPAPPPEAPAAPASASRPPYAFLAGLAFLVLLADLGSKAWAKARLEGGADGPPDRVVVIPDWVELVFARNKGGAWGILQDQSDAIRRPFFVLVALGAVVFILSLYRKLEPGQWALRWGLPLVLGGALGNLVDRVRYDFVIDFIDVFWKDHHWPTFNVADIAICVGVGLMALDMFASRKAEPPAKPKSSAEGSGSSSVEAK